MNVDVHDMNSYAAMLGNELDGVDEFRCDALVPETLFACQIVDAELAALLIKAVKNVAGQSTDNLAFREGCDSDGGADGRKPGEGRLTGLPFEVGLGTFEGVTGEPKYLAERRRVSGLEDPDRLCGSHRML